MTESLLLIAVLMVAAVPGLLLWDWLRERRALRKHLKRLDERKQAYERFKEKKRQSAERRQQK